MKTSYRIIAVTLTALALSSLFAVSTVAAGEPASGLMISAADLAFLESDHTGIRTPVARAVPIGLFSAIEARYLAGPYVSGAASAAAPAVDAMPGLMISGTDLRFIAGPGVGAVALADVWTAGADRFGIGQ